MDAPRRYILVRYGEIGLKGKNRPQFEQLLIDRLKAATGRRVVKTFGRLFIPVESDADEAETTAQVGRVFGVVSSSPARRVPLELEAVGKAACVLMQDAMPVASFKVETRRPNKGFPHDSIAVNRLVGAQLSEAFPTVPVDVNEPELTIQIELRDEGAYVYARQDPAPGGLPVGASGRGLLLLSGGIDSPVAGWYALKRGLALDAVHFHSFPFTSERALDKVKTLAGILSAWGGPERLFVVHFTKAQTALRQGAPAALVVTLMRRLMLRIAARLAAQAGAGALISGESLGQVASQTLESLAVIEASSDLPVLRPLIGFDKAEIMAKARALETYETSILPYEDCCSLFVPKHPETRPRLAQVEAIEAGLDLAGLIDEAVAGVETLSVAELNPASANGARPLEAGPYR